MSAKTDKLRGRGRTKLLTATKTIYSFDLIYKAPIESYDEIEAAILEAGREDIFLGWRDGSYQVGFSRQAPSFRIALLSAIADVECLGLGLELAAVEVE